MPMHMPRDFLSYYTTKICIPLSSPYCIIQISSVHDCILEAYIPLHSTPLLFSSSVTIGAEDARTHLPYISHPLPSLPLHQPLPAIISIYKSLLLRFICIIIVIININIIIIIISSSIISSPQSCHPLTFPSGTI